MHLSSSVMIGWALLALAGCRVTGSRAEPAPVHEAHGEDSVSLDPHSASTPQLVRVAHLDLELDLDFDARRLHGSAVYTLERFDSLAPLVLDTASLGGIAVFGMDGSPRAFKLGPKNGRFGRALQVDLSPSDQRIRITWFTQSDGQALQWLDKSQTANQTHQFMYSQGQPILTRSWLPVQDTPGNRVTWSARVRAPRELRVVMSGEGTGASPIPNDPDHLSWQHELSLPVPPYLIALACGRLDRRAISPRVAVFAEPKTMELAVQELGETEAMLAAAEELFGPYSWGRYDILILPPAFPYGGMENPLLTFATPTILAGDRSLVSLIAHELAHSWSGNLVTNRTWEDFWLNEGFTVYCEQRIIEAVYGVERSAMERVLARSDLLAEMEVLEPWQTVLAIDLAGRHPRQGFTWVPYEKGALLLRRIEELVGREDLDGFLKTWFSERAFQSVSTKDFGDAMRNSLFKLRPGAMANLDLDLWLYQPGLPDDAPEAVSEALIQVDTAVSRVIAGVDPAQLGAEGWNTFQWLRFIAGLGQDATEELLAALDEQFALTATGNAEVLCAWLELGTRRGYPAVDSRLEEFLLEVGRRKFLMPLYSALLESVEGRERAKRIYSKARPLYHAVTRTSLDSLLHE